MYTLYNIQAKGFRLFKDLDIYLNERGLTYVGGENSDVPGASSNMSGKSTLPIAITWCLYECDLAGKRLTDSIISNGSDTTKVELTLLDFTTGDQLDIIRTRTRDGNPTVHTKVQLRENDINNAQTYVGRAEEVQHHIDAIFGPKDLFLATHFFGHDENSTPFACQGDAAQKSFFDLLVMTEDLSNALQRTSLRKKHIELCILDRDTKLSGLKGRRDATREIVQAANQAQETEIAQAKATCAKLVEEKKQCTEAKDYCYGSYHRLSTNLSEARTKLEEKENEVEDEICKLAATLSSLNTELSNIELELVKLHKLKLKRCTECNQLISPKYTSIEILEMTETQLRKKNIILRNINETEILIGKFEVDKDLRELTDRISKLQSKSDRALDTYTKHSEAVNDANRRLKIAKAELKTFQNACPPDTLRKMRHELNILTHILRNTEALHEPNKDELRDLGILEIAFGRSGIRSFRLDQLTPILNTYAALYSDALFGDGTELKYSTQSRTKAGELKDKFEVALYDNITKLDALSSGQAMRRDIINTLSMVKLAEELGLRTLDILVFDEVFRTLDTNGIEEVIKLLRAFEKDVDTILVIEHNDELRSQFDKSITVVREGNKSTIMEVS